MSAISIIEVVPDETITLLDLMSTTFPKVVFPAPKILSLILYESVVISKSLMLNFVG